MNLVYGMAEETSAAPVPKRLTMSGTKRAAEDCRACPLWENATQTVFGEGPKTARIVMIGEQPGDQEDVKGKPFVGPAGRVLDEALQQAGIARKEVYVTNAVKHFKFEMRGKRRLHKKPGVKEVRACHPWLEAELKIVQPEVVVALGATAAQALMGREFRVTRDRGKRMEVGFAPAFLATIHPSSILRGDPNERQQAMAAFVEDLKKARA